MFRANVNLGTNLRKNVHREETLLLKAKLDIYDYHCRYKGWEEGIQVAGHSSLQPYQAEP